MGDQFVLTAFSSSVWQPSAGWDFKIIIKKMDFIEKLDIYVCFLKGLYIKAGMI
jgi:hypothetical protein